MANRMWSGPGCEVSEFSKLLSQKFSDTSFRSVSKKLLREFASSQEIVQGLSTTPRRPSGRTAGASVIRARVSRQSPSTPCESAKLPNLANLANKYNYNCFFGRMRLKKHSEKTDDARPKREQDQRKKERASSELFSISNFENAKKFDEKLLKY